MALSSSTAAAALRQPQFASSIAAPVKKTLQQKRFYTIPNFTSVWNHYQYIHGRSNEGGGGATGEYGLLGVLTSFPEKFRRTLLVYIKSKLFRLTYILSWYFDGWWKLVNRVTTIIDKFTDEKWLGGVIN